MKWKWMKIKKYYKGGGSEYQIRYPDIKISGITWDEIFEYVGDNTEGGQAYGYDIRSEKLPVDKETRTIKVSDVAGLIERLSEEIPKEDAEEFITTTIKEMPIEIEDVIKARETKE